MSVVAVKIKIMPESPGIDLTSIQKQVKEILEYQDVKNPMFEIEPVAFGLKSLNMMFGWPEDTPLETLEEQLNNIPGVGSVEIVDIRRAIG